MTQSSRSYNFGFKLWYCVNINKKIHAYMVYHVSFLSWHTCIVTRQEKVGIAQPISQEFRWSFVKYHVKISCVMWWMNQIRIKIPSFGWNHRRIVSLLILYIFVMHSLHLLQLASVANAKRKKEFSRYRLWINQHDHHCIGSCSRLYMYVIYIFRIFCRF